MDPMTVSSTHDKPAPSPLCFTLTIEMSLHINFFIYFVSFFMSCLLLLVLIMIFYKYYLLWNKKKIESTHEGDRSLSPRLPAWSLGRMIRVTPSV